jgi:hypothetical protein
MRELNFIEVNQVAGGANAFSDGLEFIAGRIGGALMATAVTTVVGGMIGYMRGGDATGVWGLGIIGQLVGAVSGGLIGGIGGAIGGLIVPPDYAFKYCSEAIQVLINGQIK